MRRACIASVAVLALVAGTAPAQETVDNPEFANWSKFPKCTSVTRTSTIKATITSEVVVTVTLVEVGSDKLVLETLTTSESGDIEIKSAGLKRDVPKTVVLPKGITKEELAGDKPAGKFEEGTETLKVGGTEYKTKWVKFKTEFGEIKTVAQVWSSDEMPGRRVKMESKTTGPNLSSTTTDLFEVKKP